MKKENLRTYCYYAVVVVLSFCAYYWLHNLSEGTVKTLLDFYKTVVEVFFNNSHYYVEEFGYYAGNFYTIGENCLGLGITALIFGCCGILTAKTLRGYKRVSGIILSAPIAFVSGVFVNILRLISSIYFITFAKFELIHALLGIVIYLSILLIYYRLFMRLNNRSTKLADTNAGNNGVSEPCAIGASVTESSAPESNVTGANVFESGAPESSVTGAKEDVSDKVMEDENIE